MATRVTYCTGAITGLSLTVAPADGPLIVMIPGGGGGASQFDIPGASFLETAARNDLAAVALNRPAQGDSAPLNLDAAADEGAFAANAERLMTAIDDIWTASGDRHPGVVIYGASIGGAISLHMAARWSAARRAWPLLGVSVADIGQVAPKSVIDTWRALPPDPMVNLAQYLGVFVAGVPAFALPRRPPPQNASGQIVLPIPRAELQEVVGAWPRGWRTICARISVPVQYALAQYDSAWDARLEHVAAFAAALREGSPYVEAGLFDGASHSIAIGPLGTSHMLNVCAFAHRCAIMAASPAMLEHRA